MFLPLKVIVSKKPRKNGTNVIYIQYCYSPTNRVLLRTGIAVPHEYWNQKRQVVSKNLPEEFGNYELLNTELSRMHKAIETIIVHGESIKHSNLGQYVKGIFTPEFHPNSLAEKGTHMMLELSFFAQIDDYIASQRKRVRSVAVIKCMRDRLMEYQYHLRKKITFSMLDYNFYTGLVEFLTYDYIQRRRKVIEYGLKVSTIGKTIKTLRVFIKDRVRRKLITPINMDDFKIVDEETDAIYLSNEEIAQIYHTDLSAHPYLIDYRDLFVLGCLSGLRFSDYSTLNYSDLRSGMLYKKAEKTDCWVVIPLRSEAKEIFIRQFKGKTHSISNPVFNRYIKIIAELAGITDPITFSYKKGNRDVVVTKSKAQWVTSHTCRRSFCTNEYLAGTDINLIMKISGHKTHKDFFKYIRITQQEAALKMQQIWLERDNMQAFKVPKAI